MTSGETVRHLALGKLNLPLGKVTYSINSTHEFVHEDNKTKKKKEKREEDVTLKTLPLCVWMRTEDDGRMREVEVSPEWKERHVTYISIQ